MCNAINLYLELIFNMSLVFVVRIERNDINNLSINRTDDH